MRIDGSKASHGLLQHANRGAAGKRLPSDIRGCGIIEMDRVGRRVAGSRREGGQIYLQLAYAVRSIDAGDIRDDGTILLDLGTVAIRGARRAANEMVAFVGSEDKQGVALIDAGFLQVLEERAKGGIEVSQLSYVRSFTGAESPFGAEGCAFLIVVRVGDIGKHHGDAFFQHSLDHGERLGRGRIEVQLVEAGKRNSVVIGDTAGGAAGQRGVYVLEAEKGLIARVAARFVWQCVVYSHHAQG